MPANISCGLSGLTMLHVRTALLSLPCGTVSTICRCFDIVLAYLYILRALTFLCQVSVPTSLLYKGALLTSLCKKVVLTSVCGLLCSHLCT